MRGWFGRSSRKVIVPNRKIVGEILHNFGGSRQLSLTLAVAQPGDLTALLRGVRDVVMSNPRVLKDPPPAIGSRSSRTWA